MLLLRYSKIYFYKRYRPTATDNNVNFFFLFPVNVVSVNIERNCWLRISALRLLSECSWPNVIIRERHHTYLALLFGVHGENYTLAQQLYYHLNITTHLEYQILSFNL